MAPEKMAPKTDVRKIPGGKSGGGELPRPLHEVAGPDPEPLEAAQRHDDFLQVFVGNRGLAQHLDMPMVHRAQLVAQLAALLGQPDMDRAAVMHRTLLPEIAVLH